MIICGGEDSNLHPVKDWILNPARLPIPPPPHVILFDQLTDTQSRSPIRNLKIVVARSSSSTTLSKNGVFPSGYAHNRAAPVKKRPVEKSTTDACSLPHSRGSVCSRASHASSQDHKFLAALRYESYAARTSISVSPANFSRKTRAISKATTFSTTTLAAGTAQTSLRS
jgi:hypothetical protein